VPHSSKGLLNARVSIVVDVRSARYVMSNLLQDHHTDSKAYMLFNHPIQKISAALSGLAWYKNRKQNRRL
jgi:hypothetical protein